MEARNVASRIIGLSNRIWCRCFCQGTVSEDLLERTLTPALRFIGYQIHHLASHQTEVTTTQKDFDQFLLRTQKHVPADVNALDLCWSTRGHTTVAHSASKRRGSTGRLLVTLSRNRVPLPTSFSKLQAPMIRKWPCFFAVARQNVIAAEQLIEHERDGQQTNTRRSAWNGQW